METVVSFGPVADGGERTTKNLTKRFDDLLSC